MRGPPRPPPRKGVVVLHPPALRGWGAVDSTFCKVLLGSPLPDSIPGLQIPVPDSRPVTEGFYEQPAETEQKLWHGRVSALTRLFPMEQRCLSREGREFAGLEVVAVPHRSGVLAAAPASP